MKSQSFSLPVKHTISNDKAKVNEIEALSKFDNLIFYSTKGIVHALQGYRALKALGFSKTFYTAYLLFSESGEITNSHIVLDAVSASPHEKDLRQDQTLAFISASSPLPKLEGEEDEIAALLAEKARLTRATLEALVHQLQLQLNEVVEKENLYLSPTFFQLLDLYEKNAQRLHEDLESSLVTFRSTHPNLNEALVERYLREYGLLDFYGGL